MKTLEKLTPRLPKRILFFLAALLWTFAGSMLLIKGFAWFHFVRDYRVVKLVGSIILGLIFYFFMFAKLSKKHTQRIFKLSQPKPCAFSFFNYRSYSMMVVMISMGIGLRTSGIVSFHVLSLLYITMGIPLLLSSLRFYYSGFFYHKIL